MCSSSTLAICCPERARLEKEYIAARDRMRNLLRLRQVAKPEQRRLANAVAMASARLKGHGRRPTVANAGSSGFMSLSRCSSRMQDL